LDEQKEVHTSQFAFIRKIKSHCARNTNQKGEKGTEFLIFNKNKNKRLIIKGKGSFSIFQK